METLFIIFASAFAIATLGWFSTWAFWVHPPEGWLGKAVITVMPLDETNAVRHSAWYRRLKVVTLLLGLTTFALLAALIKAHTS